MRKNPGAREREHDAAAWSAVAHDLRQPLQALRLLHGALRRAIPDPALHEMLDSQQEAIDELERRIDALPGSRPAAGRDGAAGRPASAIDSGPGSAAPAYIVVVEDDPQIRKAWERLLCGEGYRVACVSCLEELRAVLAGTDCYPDLVITDYRLADGADGLRVVRAVRDAAHSTVPALVITGEPSSIGSEADGLLDCRIVAKPVRPAVLLELVRGAIGLQGSPARGAER